MSERAKTLLLAAAIVVAILLCYQEYLDHRRVMAMCSFDYAASNHAFMCW